VRAPHRRLRPARLWWAACACALAVLAAVSVADAWAAVPRWPTSHRPLLAVDFVDRGTGWAVGASGVIVRTTTGGALWTRQRSLATAAPALRDVCFVDRLRGWAVGDGGIILRTADGGVHWRQQASGTKLPLRSVAFADARRAWVVGGSSGTAADGSPLLAYALLGTSDTGTHWKLLAHGQGRFLAAVEASGDGTLWVAGCDLRGAGAQARRQAFVQASADGGATWAPPLSLAALGLDRYERSAAADIEAPDAAALVVAGSVWNGTGWSGFVVRSANAGAAWSPPAVSHRFAAFLRCGFAGPSNGWMVGSGGGSAVLRTVDGGATWSRQRLPTGTVASAVAAAGPSVAYVAGDGRDHRGLVARTLNAGVSWLRVR